MLTCTLLTCHQTEDFTFGRMKMGGEEIVGGGKNKNKKYRDKPEKVKEANGNTRGC